MYFYLYFDRYLYLYLDLYLSRRRGRVGFFNTRATFSGETGGVRLFVFVLVFIFVFVLKLYFSSFYNAHTTFSGETGGVGLFARSFAGTDFKEAYVFVHSERGLRVEDGESER